MKIKQKKQISPEQLNELGDKAKDSIKKVTCRHKSLD